MISLNNNWQFVQEFSQDFLDGRVTGESVRLPHTVSLLPYHYADSEAYQMISGYKTTIDYNLPAGKRAFVQFDGAGHIATVYVNGTEVLTHKCGYTSFRVEITEALRQGSCDLTVKLDSTENPSIPPFGFMIDYLTFGGLYREVWLDIVDEVYLEDVYVANISLNEVKVCMHVSDNKEVNKTIQITTLEGEILKEVSTSDSEVTIQAENITNWSLDNPQLYLCKIYFGDSCQKEVKFGFRTAEFKGNDFYLNGEKTFIRGLNRHQSYPYVGYAASESLQREDARILKQELACTAVRTSHYPQSHYFIDECDKLGLLVFTEIPGWQHIGDLSWQDQAVENVKEMIVQYRNHPSIILWGVRINESIDNDDFYTRTNKVAHQADPYRATGGVRCIMQSNLLEDVYTYNDFVHEGDNPGVRPKETVTPDVNKPLLVTEACGHMYPTKAYDKIEVRLSQALRHARVLNDASADGQHAGVFTWCMFDYNTHKDFGSGDRICYHGVLDGFRNPKLAAYVFASQQDETPVLEVGSSMDIGDYPASILKNVYVFTNGDKVRVYKNDVFVKEYEGSEYSALKHGPIHIDDLVGELLETQEGYDSQKAADFHYLLVAASKEGVAKLSDEDQKLLQETLAKYQMNYLDFDRLYGRYVGNWGGESISWRFEALRNGEVIASKTVCPSAKLHLEVKVSQTALKDEDKYDMAAVRIRVLDENGNLAPYAQLAIEYHLDGPLTIVGPQVSVAEGGLTGTYLKTAGQIGKARLAVSSYGLKPVFVDFEIN